MTIPELFLIAFGLSMDCFAVSVGFGATRKLEWKDVVRMAFFFGLFQGLMPLAGWLIGHGLQSLIESIDHWIAFSILAFIGLKMIWQSIRSKDEERPDDITRLSVLLPLSVATSIDALITGIGFGFIRTNIFEAVIIISTVTFLVSLAGARISAVIRFIPARWAELAGGIALILIGIKILLEHLSLL